MTSNVSPIKPNTPKPIKAPARRGLRIKTVRDMLREGRALYRATRTGDLPSVDGFRLMAMIRALAELASVAELEEKLAALEKIAACVESDRRLPALPAKSAIVDDEEGGGE